MASSSPVYDPETESGGQPTYRTPPDLGPGHNRAAGDPSDPRGDLRQAESGKPRTGSGSGGNFSLGSSKSGHSGSSSGSGSFNFNPKGDDNGAASKAGLAAAEAGTGTTGSSSGLFNDSTNKNSRFSRFVKKNRKKALIGGGTGAGIIGLIVAGFLMLVPLKIEHIVNNLQDRFMSTSNSAVQEETQNLFKGYMKKILPAYKSCGNTAKRGCSPSDFGDGPVGKLYKTWSSARLENKLADDYGIDFQYDGSSKHWKLKTSNAPAIDVGTDGDGLDKTFNSRSSARSAISDALDNALEGETKWKSMMIRYKTGRLLEEKYGIKRCLIFCGTRDALADKANLRKKAAQLYLVQRVITPHTETLGTVLECLVSGCSLQSEPTSAGDGTAETAGEPLSPTEQKIQAVRQAAAEKLAAVGGEQLAEELDTVQEKGYQKYLISKVLSSVGLSEISDQVADAAPVVGWIQNASQLIGKIDSASGNLKKLGYIANAGSAVSLYMMYRTYADEIHTGNVNATEVGSLVNSLGNGNNGATSDPEVGGTASAENTPLYQNIIDGNTASTSSQTSLIDSLLPVKAYADSSTSPGDSTTTSNQYECSGGGGVPSGSMVCPEEILGQGNGVANSIHSTLHTAPLSYVTTLASAWNSTVGSLFNTLTGFFSSVLGIIPGVTSAENAISGAVSGVIQPFEDFITNKLIPNPWGSNMSGGRTFDMMAAGADVAGNDNAHTELGGQRLTPQQTADIMNQQEDEAKQQFNNQSFFARMFSTDSQYSLISKLAMDIPFSKQAAVQTGFASVLNPLSTLGNGFGSIFSGKANASQPAQADPFGVTQYGYPEGTIPSDPQTYWDNHCSDNASNAYMKDNSWNEAAAAYDTSNDDDPSGMPVNTTTNPCLLIMATVGSAGGYFDTSNLTKDDLADVNANSGAGGLAASTPTGGLTNPFPGGWTPGRLDMGYDGTFKGQLVAPFSGTITYASVSFSNWGGWIELKSDNPISGLAGSTLYFAEGVKPAAGITAGKHVNAGDPIGDAYTTGAQAGVPGNIEWGIAQDGSVGTPTNTYVYGQCGSQAAKTVVMQFSNWTQNQLGVAAPAETSNAGCP